MPVAAHTPGPWRWFDYPDGRKLLSGRDRAVIHCPDAPITCDPEDARLIGAAPELLKLAHAAHDALKSYAYGNASPDLANSVAAALEETIAKAEGR